MTPVILNIDRSAFIYMFDIFEPKLIFALTKKEYRKFKFFYHQFEYYEEVLKMPETYTVKVYPLEEIDENTYELKEMNPIVYPVKRIYTAIPH